MESEFWWISNIKEKTSNGILCKHVCAYIIDISKYKLKQNWLANIVCVHKSYYRIHHNKRLENYSHWSNPDSSQLAELASL